MDNSQSFVEHGHWFLRIAIASVFIYHGMQKGISSGPYEMIVNKWGFTPLIFYLVMMAELAGGTMVLIGGLIRDLITRLGALMLIPIMLGAIFWVHLPYGWNFLGEGPGGMEFQVTLLLILCYLLVVGNMKPQAETETASP